MRHQYSEREYKVAEVACYGPREDIDGVHRPPFSVLELTKTEVDGSSVSDLRCLKLLAVVNVMNPTCVPALVNHHRSVVNNAGKAVPFDWNQVPVEHSVRLGQESGRRCVCRHYHLFCFCFSPVCLFVFIFDPPSQLELRAVVSVLYVGIHRVQSRVMGSPDHCRSEAHQQ